MKFSEVDVIYKEGYVLPELTIEIFRWYKAKFVHYRDENNYRFRGTIDGKVLLDLKDLGSHNYKQMKLMSQSKTSIGNLRNIRITGRFMIFF